MITVKELIQELEKLPPNLYLLKNKDDVYYSVDSTNIEWGLKQWFEYYGQTEEQREQDMAVVL